MSNKNEVYEKVSILNIINQLELIQTSVIGDNIYVVCPFCSNTMKVNTTNNAYSCNSCERSGYAVGLYAKANHITTKAAFKELLDKELRVDYSHLYYLKRNMQQSEDYRDIVYSSFLDKLSLSSEHNKKLSEMTFSNEYILKHRFKSIPEDIETKKQICSELMNEGFTLEGLPGFYQESFEWTFKSHARNFYSCYSIWQDTRAKN